MKLLDKLTDKLTNLLLDYIRRKNGRGRICRFLGVNDDFMTSLKLSDLKSSKFRSARIPDYGLIIRVDTKYLEGILHLYGPIYDVTDISIPIRCRYCIFGYYDKCRAASLTLDISPCNFYNEEGEIEKQILFMSTLSLIKLERMCYLRTNRSLFIISYIRYNTACLSVKR